MFPSDLLAEDPAAFATEETKSSTATTKPRFHRILSHGFVCSQVPSPDSLPIAPQQQPEPQICTSSQPRDCASMRHHLDSFSCRVTAPAVHPHTACPAPILGLHCCTCTR